MKAVISLSLHTLLVTCALPLPLAGADADSNGSALQVEDPRVEYLVDPVGIDTRRPRFGWKLVDAVLTRGQKQTSYQIVVTAEGAENKVLWDSGKVESGESARAEYAGEKLVSNQAARWKVRVWDKDGRPSGWSREARFAMGLLDAADWQGEWIGTRGVDERKHIWFRRNFALDKVPDRAVVHLASIGYHEFYVNGRRVGDVVLAPAVTNLTRRVAYMSYEIGDHLREGDNVIAVWTGPGWARADGSYGKGVWKQEPAFKCQIDMSDGTRMHSGTDWKWAPSHSENLGLWKGGGEGEYGGEQIDARAYVPGWNRPEHDDGKWADAVVIPKPELILTASMWEPDRKVEAIKPVAVIEKDGMYIYDMGRNFTGWHEFKLRNGREGQVVRFTTANREGQIVEYDQESRYIHDATGEGVFSHRFNYAGGRWITVHGLDYKPALEDLTGHIVSNDRVRTGRFECSKPMFNDIFEIDLRTYIANTVNGVTMDCPHRERYGYGEIALACSWGCAIPQYDSAPYYRKVAQDWFDVQREDGFVNTIAPQIYRGAGGTLWSSAPVTMSWEFHKAYGDMRQLEAAYGPMKKWLDYLSRSVSADGVLVAYESAGRFLGDWATPHGSEYGNKPEAKLFNNCVYAYCLMVITEAAQILGKAEDRAIYQKRLEDLRVKAHKHFYDAENKRYIDGRQLAMAFPLYVGITPESERAAVMAGFVEEITRRKPYLDTGSSGLPILLKFLVEDIGRADILFDCLKRTEHPGYGHFLEVGATTWPEYWNYQDHDSQIHTCYTGIAGYFTKSIGGIQPDPDEWGMKKFIIRPQLVGDLTFANTESGSCYGRIVSRWSREAALGTFEIEVPPNTTATVHIPAAREEDVTESGKPAAQAAGVKAMGAKDGCQVFVVESGRYVFISRSVPAAKNHS